MNEEQRDSRVEQALLRNNISAIYLLPKLLDFEKDDNSRLEWFHDEVHLEPSGHKAYGAIIGKELSAQLTIN